MQPRIYLGKIPPTIHERVELREHALLLTQRLRQSQTVGMCAVLLHFSAGAHSPLQCVDLLLLRGDAIMVGALRAYPGPIAAMPGEAWRDRLNDRLIVEEDGAFPLHRLRAQRDAIQVSLNAAAERLGLAARDSRPFRRVYGAVVCVPQVHPDSQISLDVDDHRDGLKVCGFDELPGVAAMLHTDLMLNDAIIETIAGGVFGGRLWHDGNHFLFDLAAPRFRLRIITPGNPPQIAPLLEGTTVVGRRRAARRVEQRITVAGDDLISLDHLYLTCDEASSTVTIRDDSKNGTWLTTAGGAAEHLRGQTRAIAAGARLRIGTTDITLESI